MQSRLTFSKRCEIAKRKNANEENRLRHTLERCEKEYDRTMKSMFVERHGVRSSIKNLRTVKRISLDTKPLVESGTYVNRSVESLDSGGHGFVKRSPDSRHSVQVVGGATASRSPEVGHLTRVAAMGQRTTSMPDLRHESANTDTRTRQSILDHKSSAQPTTEHACGRSLSKTRKRCRTLPESSVGETSDNEDQNDSGNCTRSEQDPPTQPRMHVSVRCRSSLACIHGGDSSGFVRRFRALTIPEIRPLKEQGPDNLLARGKEELFVNIESTETETGDAATPPLSHRSSLLRRPRSCSVRTISAPGVIGAQATSTPMYADSRPRSVTLPECIRRPRSMTLPGCLNRSTVTGFNPREEDYLQGRQTGDQVRLLELDRGDLMNSPRFRRRLSPSAGIAKLRQEGDAAMASRALISSYRRDQGMVKTAVELKATRQEARRRLEKKKESTEAHTEEDLNGSKTRKKFMSIVHFVLAVNAFKSLKKKKIPEGTGDK